MTNQIDNTGEIILDDEAINKKDNYKFLNQNSP